MIGRLARRAAETLGACLAAGIPAVALGLASKTFYVIGLLPVVTGLCAGAGAGAGALVSSGRIGRATWAGAVVGILVASTAFWAIEDGHFQGVFADDLAASRYVASGMPTDGELPRDERAFFASDAAEALDKEVRRETGYGGAVGRWIVRARSGVRLLGPWDRSRGLSVGLPGAVAWAVIELLLAMWVARKVLHRLAQRTSAREPDDLDGQRHDDDRAADPGDGGGLEQGGA